MENLVLNINGEVIIAKEPKGKTWREIAKLLSEKTTIEDLIEYRAKLISYVFGNVTVEKILDNLTLSEITNLSDQCDGYIAKIINPRLAAIEKNLGEGETTTQSD